jgi:hypothetical protein
VVLFLQTAGLIVVLVSALYGLYKFVSGLYIDVDIEPFIFHKTVAGVKFLPGGAVDIPTDTKQSWIDFKLTNNGDKLIRKFRVIVYEPGWISSKKVYGTFESLYETIEPKKTVHVFVYVADGGIPLIKATDNTVRIKIKVGYFSVLSNVFTFASVPGQLT